MKDVLDYPQMPKDCDIAIEYNIPQTSKRVDFMVLGKDRHNEDHIVIVGLKQWSHVEKIDDKLLVTSVIDNLLKGASGQAVQNMNLMFGIDEHAGLDLKPSAF